MMRVRHTDEWVGALVIAAIAVLTVAILQAGVLRDEAAFGSEAELVEQIAADVRRAREVRPPA